MAEAISAGDPACLRCLMGSPPPVTLAPCPAADAVGAGGPWGQGRLCLPGGAGRMPLTGGCCSPGRAACSSNNNLSPPPKKPKPQTMTF